MLFLCLTLIWTLILTLFLTLSITLFAMFADPHIRWSAFYHTTALPFLSVCLFRNLKIKRHSECKHFWVQDWLVCQFSVVKFKVTRCGKAEDNNTYLLADYTSVGWLRLNGWLQHSLQTSPNHWPCTDSHITFGTQALMHTGYFCYFYKQIINVK